MNNNGQKNGFTLAELLVVVAIIAIIVAVSVPIFASKTKETREAACAANRRSAKALLTEEYMAGENMPAENADLSNQTGFPQFKDIVCPDDGGIIGYEIKNGSIKVYCTKHTPIENMGTAMEKIVGVIEECNLGPMDSEAVNFTGSNTQKFLEELKNKGIDLNELNAKSWKIEGTSFYWTDKPISESSPGEPIVIMKYNFSGAYKGLYSVWDASVTTSTNCSQANGQAYNVINLNGTKEITTSSDNKRDFDAIYKIFKEKTK